MSSRSERDKQKSLNEKHQMILSSLLKDEDNKYCVDCDAKGPRWASWNLGIFLCIRCAGIHRNLGVHISKVKSVNLDTWTAEQIAMMQEMGNSRARAVYEANLPDNFRRPQTDSGLEAFIRAKYEQKKYIAQEWVPPKPKVQPIVDDPPKKEKKKNRPRPAGGVQLNNVPAPSKSASAAKTETKPQVTVPAAKETKAPPPASVDLLGLDTPAIPASGNPGNSSNDLFGEFISGNNTAPASTANGEAGATNTTSSTEATSSNGLEDMNLFGNTGETAGTADKQKATKESILALYGSGGGGAQMFGVPGGMYMPNAVPQQQQQPAQQQAQQQQQQQQQQMWGAAAMQNGVMGANQSAAMGMQGMMGVQGNAMMGGVPQPNMMMGQMPGTNQGMMSQAGMMPNMFNMPQQGMYTMPQQMQQVQGQMSTLNLGGSSMSAMPQQPNMVAAGGTTATNWGAQGSGQTLSNNLWQ